MQTATIAREKWCVIYFNVQKLWKLDRLCVRDDLLVITVQKLFDRIHDVCSSVRLNCCRVQRKNNVVAVSCSNAFCLEHTTLCWVFQADIIAFNKDTN